MFRKLKRLNCFYYYGKGGRKERREREREEEEEREEERDTEREGGMKNRKERGRKVRILLTFS
jgi:hypothetical protein